MADVPKLLIVGFLMLYRALISPLYGQTCRFYPSCSQYALTAVQRHGAVRGSWLAGRRLLRCHPWNPGGIDHVPPVRSKSGCEHGVTEQASSPASLVTEPGSSESTPADRRMAPTDQNCAPSASRRAA
ncbi:membrane protein insertion efficiency factor YidD [Kineosporia babensis]|uniref:membrane protein insertion efficiency factor YidD n=1 Tax=Kineosporia babensis TaxID=499548 RepID=UPI0038B2923E